MAEISQITTVNGTTYDLKDTVARNMAGGGIQLKGETTTPLTDGATTNPITINGQSYTAVNQDAVFYGNKEFVFDGTHWHEFGDMSGLGALATKDSASGSFTPQGSVSISVGTGTANYTPAGTNASSSVSGSCTVTPQGSVSAPTITVTPSTDDVYSITAVGSLPALTMTVSSENLTFGWDAGALPTKGSKQTVMTGASASADAPSFTGTEVTGSISGTASAQTFTGTGAELKGTFSGTAGTVTVS